jgi:hypothetical protein
MARLPTRRSLVTRNEDAVDVASITTVRLSSVLDSPINHCLPQSGIMQS